MSDGVQRLTDAPKCDSGDHQFEFFDSFPGHEIEECQKCGLRKFTNVQTGEETYYGRERGSEVEGRMNKSLRRWLIVAAIVWCSLVLLCLVGMAILPFWKPLGKINS